MSFKSAVGEVVSFQVKFTLREGSVDRLFSVTLTCNRRKPEEIDEQPSDQLVKDFLLENTIDWSGNRLVLDPVTSEPVVDFSKAAFDYMLKHPGVLADTWAAYLLHTASKTKN